MSQKNTSPVADHGHCLVCGHSIPPGRPFCSDQCEQDFLAQRRRQRRTSWMFMGALLLLFLLWIFLSARPAG